MNLSKHIVSSLAATILFGGVLSVPQAAHASVINDPTGDFVTGYTGPKNGDLDVVSAEASYNGSVFHLLSQFNGPVGTTATAFYVWGFNRGSGTARFGALAPGVLFDSVVILTPGGTSSVRDLLTNVTTNLDPSAVSFSGNTLTADFSGLLLPAAGFTIDKYTVNLWPRLPGGATLISDFAPDNSNAAVTQTPEPGTVAMTITGVVTIALARRRQRLSSSSQGGGQG